MSIKTTYTIKALRDAVKESFSVAKVFSKLGLQASGGNYKTFKMKCEEYNIDISHFTGKAHLRGKTHNWGKKIPIEDILVKKSTYGCTNRLKKRLFDDGFFEKKCYQCGLTEWNEKPAPLQLEHINGDNTDNRIENLTILCPNCHAQTETYCKKKSWNKGSRVQEKKCIDCGIEVSAIKYKRCPSCASLHRVANQKHCKRCKCQISKKSRSGLCLSCANRLKRKIDHPTKDELQTMILSMTWTDIGKKYGVSDNAVRKWAKTYKLI